MPHAAINLVVFFKDRVFLNYLFVYYSLCILVCVLSLSFLEYKARIVLKLVWCALIRTNLGLSHINCSTRIIRFSFLLTGHSNPLEQKTKAQPLPRLFTKLQLLANIGSSKYSVVEVVVTSEAVLFVLEPSHEDDKDREIANFVRKVWMTQSTTILYSGLWISASEWTH